ncbi:MAG: MerR family transcriptional regulator [Oscillospiraceae bacterium]|nr:MerR family transcriptional regulator [Oscillospiraceae bacterium]
MKRYFKIGEVAEMLGISADTLRFYEKKDLIVSSKDPRNGYRYYEPQEIYNLMDVLFYRSLDISIQDISDIITTSDPRGLRELMGNKSGEIRRKIEEYQKLYKRIQNLMETLERVEQNYGKYELASMPPVVVVNEALNIGQSYLEDLIARNVYPTENIFYYLQAFTTRWEGGECLIDRIYTTIPQRHVLRGDTNGRYEGNRVLRCEKCLRTVFSAWAGESQGQIGQAVQWAREHGYRLTGDLTGFWIYTAYSRERPVDYVELYLPVE